MRPRMLPVGLLRIARRTINLSLLAFVIASVLAILPMATASGSDESIDDYLTGSSFDLTALVDETQKQSKNPQIMDMVWWLPVEYWQCSMAQDPSIREKDIRELEKVVSPYTIIAVSFGNIGYFGGVTWLDSDQLRRQTVLLDAAGNEFEPLPPGEVNPNMRNLAAMMQQTIASNIGAIGENMNFFFFPALGLGSEPIAAASQEGSFAVRVASETYAWRLPLGAVLPPRKCPECDEPMPGNWKFCPWHGNELVDATVD